MASLDMPLPPDESQGPAINAIAWTGFAISSLFIVARLYTRLRLSRSAGWDDTVIVFAWVLNLIFVALSSVCVSHGLGRHLVYLSKSEASVILFYSAVLQPFGIMSYCVPKLAVVILLIRIMGPKARGKWFLYGIIVILFITSALSAIFIFAQCNPPSHFWNPTEPAECMSPFVLQNITLFAGSWSAFVDLCLALFPVSIFWDLQMALSRKIAISILMGLGIFAMICAIIKTSHLPEEQNPDFTYHFYSLLVWTFVETDVVIVCACVPVLPRLITALRGREQSTSRAKSHPFSQPAGSNLPTHHSRNHTYRVFDSYEDSYKAGIDSGIAGHDRPEPRAYELAGGPPRPAFV